MKILVDLSDKGNNDSVFKVHNGKCHETKEQKCDCGGYIGFQTMKDEKVYYARCRRCEKIWVLLDTKDFANWT